MQRIRRMRRMRWGIFLKEVSPSPFQNFQRIDKECEHRAADVWFEMTQSIQRFVRYNRFVAM